MDTIVVLASLFAMAMSHACPYDPAPDGVDYPLVLSIPTGCERSQCSFYVAIRVSDEDQEFLDFKMQGRASGYIAIGFGKQKSWMNDADVFACAVNPNTSMVEAFDTYNPDGLSWTNKRDIDTSQVASRNVCPRPGSLSFVNGTISCAFSRAVDVFNFVEDKFLNDFFYIQMAYTDAKPVFGSDGLLNLVDHGHNHPKITPLSINPFTNQISGSTTSVTFSGCLFVVLASLALISALL
ncbi:hypothetical protein EMCRGX_G003076 [Ephydatia muelleri]